MQETVACEIESIDLNFRQLTGASLIKPMSRFEIIASASRRLSAGTIIIRRHHAADRMYGQLLHGAIDRRAKDLFIGLAILP